MSWIKHVPYEEAEGKLKKIYDKIKGPDGYIDNILMIHGLRPHTLEAHMKIYKNVLHHHKNTHPKWLLETLGVYTSMLNGCEYCVEHHFTGLKRLLKDDERANNIRKALENESFEDVFEEKEIALLKYTKALTEGPANIDKSLIDEIRSYGYEDGEILEVNQVVAYFAYANRTVLGLGVDTKGDVLGLSPSGDNPKEWSHK
ncbi:MAG: peroxidase-related enzyme [Euryarchaeota archaeon]|nr:peroxidase-related enzyme [Euryarchaeota archaeon]